MCLEISTTHESWCSLGSALKINHGIIIKGDRHTEAPKLSWGLGAVFIEAKSTLLRKIIDNNIDKQFKV